MPRNDTIIASALFLIILAVGAVFGYNVVRTSLRERNAGKLTVPKAVSTDPMLGESSSPITMVEYGDYECPFCKDAQPIVAQFVAEHPGRVRVVWKDFPITAEHPEAQPAAEAARCAQEQGKFWQMHDALFANQDKLSSTLYGQLAAELSLDTAAFQSCLTSHSTAALVEAGRQSGIKAGVDGTPYFFLNTIAINRVPTLAELDRALLQLK